MCLCLLRMLLIYTILKSVHNDNNITQGYIFQWACRQGKRDIYTTETNQEMKHYLFWKEKRKNIKRLLCYQEVKEVLSWGSPALSLCLWSCSGDATEIGCSAASKALSCPETNDCACCLHSTCLVCKHTVTTAELQLRRHFVQMRKHLKRNYFLGMLASCSCSFKKGTKTKLGEQLKGFLGFCSPAVSICGYRWDVNILSLDNLHQYALRFKDHSFA